ncbi:MAG: hypothetical protein HRT68_07335 [Flavobacteriaceae bacterium]|nr:hypothetical protein [Flavobacteriaceae bacterium]
MSNHIKLIWEFRGPNALRTAEHHIIHLKEYIVIEKLSLNETEIQQFSEFQVMASMLVTEEEMPKVRAALKPNKGQLIKNK